MRVAYAAANWSDIQKREGVYPDPVTYPAIPGLEVSGVITDLGPGVRELREGDRVAAITGPSMLGGYAEFCVAAAEYVIPLPDTIDAKAGAAFPVVGLTAYHLLHSASAITPGMTILVHAIGGAVGLALTQLAVRGGATVIGTVGSPGKAARPRELGAHLVIDRSRESFAQAVRDFTGGRGVDLVIDSLGGDVLPQSIDLLRTYGHCINIGEAAGYPDFDIRARIYRNSTSLAGFELVHALRVPGLWRKGVQYIVDEVAGGRLHIPVEGVYDMEHHRDLHARLESRNVSGKLLLQVDHDQAASRA